MPAKVLMASLYCMLLFFIVAAQDKKNPGCADLKTGIFYNYPKNKPDQYIDKREQEWVHETNLANGDTSLWKIKWTSDCVYTLQFVAGNIKWDAKTFDFLKNHVFAFEIVNTTNDYYVYKSYIDKVSAINLQQDTMWLNQKLKVVYNELYRPVANTAILRKAHFSDTSKYAVVYLYRPGKLTNGLASYPVYFDDNLICIVKNNAGYIFKVFREGPLEIKSRLFKDESSVKVNLKFGNTYYVKSMIHWTISSRLYNFKLEMAGMKEDAGQKEFDETELNK